MPVWALVLLISLGGQGYKGEVLEYFDTYEQCVTALSHAKDRGSLMCIEFDPGAE